MLPYPIINHMQFCGTLQLKQTLESIPLNPLITLSPLGIYAISLLCLICIYTVGALVVYLRIFPQCIFSLN